jgi:hypothetical protein
MPGIHETQAIAARYDGMASDNEKAMISNSRGRNGDRATTHAAKIPMTTDALVTVTINNKLRNTSCSVRICINSSITAVNPLVNAV